MPCSSFTARSPACRYRDEVDRLYKVLDAHLAGRQYLVGDKLSYADLTAEAWCVPPSMQLQMERYYFA